MDLQSIDLLREALLAGYSDFAEIRRLLFFKGEELNEIPNNVARGPGFDALIEWAVRNEKLSILNEVLEKSRPGNPAVQAYLQGGSATPPAAEFNIPASWRPADSGLEALVQETNRLVLASRWRETMGEAEGRVCRIDAGKGQACGTGFLVGADLVLTNCHVYRGVEGKSPVARFGYGAADAKYAEVAVKEPALAVSSEDKLDFALLRLGEAVGKQRGWFKPKRHVFAVDQVQLILQHAEGEPLQIGIGRVSAVVDLPPRVTYTTNTEGGSSGSPVFTMDWQLVAIHHYGVEGVNNVGIPMAAIWETLAKGGLVG